MAEVRQRKTALDVAIFNSPWKTDLQQVHAAARPQQDNGVMALMQDGKFKASIHFKRVSCSPTLPGTINRDSNCIP